MKRVFVDFENVQKIPDSVIADETIALTILVGAQQTKLDTALVKKLLKRSGVELIQLKGTSKNALDFAVAFYLGQAVQQDKAGRFNIISKDKGYDALVEHLNEEGIHVWRHADFSKLMAAVVAKPPAKPASPASKPLPVAKPEAKVIAVSPIVQSLEEQAVECLRKHANQLPKNKSKLASFLVVCMGNTQTNEEALGLISKLVKSRYLKINSAGKVDYSQLGVA